MPTDHPQLNRREFIAQGLQSAKVLFAQGLLHSLEPDGPLTALIDLTVCTAYQGSGCNVCYQACPYPDEAIRMVEGLPQIVMDHCTACNLCVAACPTPGSISLAPRPTTA